MDERNVGDNDRTGHSHLFVRAMKRYFALFENNGVALATSIAALLLLLFLGGIIGPHM